MARTARRPRRRTFRRVAALLGLLALLSTGAAVGGVALGLGPTPCGTKVVEAAADQGSFRATFVGDTLLGDAATTDLQANGYDWSFAQLQGVVGSDFLVANAEGPITTRQEGYDPFQGWSYNAAPEAAPAIARFGIRAVSLANNHAMDRGPEGLADTIAAANAAGVATFGAGATRCEAELPLLVRSPAGTLGIVGLGMPYGRDRMATETHAGSIALSQASIARGIALARAAGADWVVALVHWGQNYRGVTSEQRDFAEQLAAAGYDLVVGAHPHVYQPAEVIAGMPVVYSMGNLVFGAPGRFPDDLGYGLVVNVTFDRTQGLSRLGFRCIVTDNVVVHFQPVACTPEQARQVLGNAGLTVSPDGVEGTLQVQ